jgi:hypothetical protein
LLRTWSPAFFLSYILAEVGSINNNKIKSKPISAPFFKITKMEVSCPVKPDKTNIMLSLPVLSVLPTD